MSNRYYLWGAGSIGKRALEYLAPLGILEGIIDNDPNKHGQVICGLEVTSYDSVKPSLNKSGVIIAHFVPKETEEILNRDKILNWRLSEFITEWYWTERQQYAIGFLDFPITTRCTLNCRDCMQYIPYRPKHDIPIETLKQELDALFRNVSFVGEISIIGGEPFLHKQLPDLLEYIRENYRGHIGSLVITTNSTVTPELRVLELCRKIGIFISVSDYSKTLPQLEDKITKFESVAQEAEVIIERKRWSWSNPGKFDVASDLEDCTQMHMQLADGKLWHCTLMAAGYMADFCPADNLLDYYELLHENSNTMRNFLNNSNMMERTAQCLKCLYPQGIEIPSAVQN
jgi:organic radical activating enzyme